MKEFENMLSFGEVMGKSLVSCFLTHGAVSSHASQRQTNCALQCVRKNTVTNKFTKLGKKELRVVLKRKVSSAGRRTA